MFCWLSIFSLFCCCTHRPIPSARLHFVPTVEIQIDGTYSDIDAMPIRLRNCLHTTKSIDYCYYLVENAHRQNTQNVNADGTFSSEFSAFVYKQTGMIQMFFCVCSQRIHLYNGDFNSNFRRLIDCDTKCHWALFVEFPDESSECHANVIRAAFIHPLRFRSFSFGEKLSCSPKFRSGHHIYYIWVLSTKYLFVVLEEKKNIFRLVKVCVCAGQSAGHKRVKENGTKTMSSKTPSKSH